MRRISQPFQQGRTGFPLGNLLKEKRVCSNVGGFSKRAFSSSISSPASSRSSFRSASGLGGCLGGLTKRSFSIIQKEIIDPFGQPHFITHPHLMREGEVTPGISRMEYSFRRQGLVNCLPENSIVVLFGNSIHPISSNMHYPFQQQSDFSYITGCLEPDSALVLEIHEQGIGSTFFGVPKKYKSTLFVQPRDPKKEMWTGPVTGPLRAPKFFGIDEALSNQDLNQFLLEKVPTYSKVFCTPQERNNKKISERMTTFLKQDCKATEIRDISPVIQNMRLLKSPAEITVMRKACELTSKAFAHTMKKAQSLVNISEQEIQAEMVGGMLMHGASAFSFPIVVAGASRATTLHYGANDLLIRPDEMVLVDAGGQFGGYCGDVTRTFPISGKFEKHHQEIYEVVLRANEECIKDLDQTMKGEGGGLKNFSYLHAKAVEVLQEGVAALGIDPTLVRLSLFPHTVGHFLGLDTHDSPKVKRDVEFTAGMVLTVEPGLYLPFDERIPKQYQGIGVRIEDDVLLAVDGVEVLSADAPKLVGHVEEVMAMSPDPFF